jgi:hypothetical protein
MKFNKFKEDTLEKLNTKVIEKILEIRSIIMEDYYDLPEDFFEMMGAIDFNDFDDHLSVVFDNKESLDLCIRNLPDDIDYDVFFYDGNDETEYEDVEQFENDPIDINNIDFNEDDWYELVIYFEDEEEELDEANQSEKGSGLKRRVSFSKYKKGGKLVSKRQRRRAGKISKGVGKGYKAKGAGWKIKQQLASRKRKISKRQNVRAQNIGKRLAKKSKLIRKRLGYK